MSAPTSEQRTAMFQASMDAHSRLEIIRNKRLYHLELLYASIKAGDPTDKNIAIMAILDELEAKQYIVWQSLNNQFLEARANSAASLASKPINFVCADEVDTWPKDYEAHH